MSSIRRLGLVALAALAAQGCAREMGAQPDDLRLGLSARAMRTQVADAPDAALLAGLSRDFAMSVETQTTFAFNSAALDDRARTTLAQQATWLIDNPAGAVRLTGHADAVGTERYNLGIGQRRAEAAARFLIAQGVPAERIAAVDTRGEAEPAVPSAGRERRNRRVVSEIAWIGRAPRPVSEMDGVRAGRVHDSYQALENAVEASTGATE